MSLAEIAAVVGGEVHDDPDEVTVTGPAFIDTRTPEPRRPVRRLRRRARRRARPRGRRGPRRRRRRARQPPDGRAHGRGPDVQAALGRLATHVLGRLPDLRVLAVTGSQGKTSTKDLLAALLADAAPTVATRGSFNNELGLPVTVLRADPSTRFLLLEMGARGIGHLRTLCAIARPDVSLVLNVGKAHIGEFGTQDDIATAKGELVEALPDDGTAVLNADDPRVAAMAARTSARVLTFGTAAGADVRLGDVALDEDGHPSFTLAQGDETADGDAAARRGAPGDERRRRAAAGSAVGIGLADSADSLGRVETLSRWRMEVRRRDDGVTVVNDAYNANPGSMEAALEALVALGGTSRRTWPCSARCGSWASRRRRSTRPSADWPCASGCTVSSLWGRCARRPHRRARAGATGEEAVHVADNDAAVRWLDSELRPGDVVLLKASNGARLFDVAAAVLAGREVGP
jgi:UDP-N-acetylmuramoyl-tripeptide--D-alanyl-D-alanine ligase